MTKMEFRGESKLVTAFWLFQCGRCDRQHPAEVSAPIQPGGERAERWLQSISPTRGPKGVRVFEWMVCAATVPNGRFEVFLTPIQLCGRQLIQAVCKRHHSAQAAEEELRRSEARLRESEARFSTAFPRQRALRVR